MDIANAQTPLESFMYALGAKETIRQYPKRLRIFFDCGLDANLTLEEQANLFNNKSISIKNIAIPNRSKKRNNYSNDYDYYEWIKRLLQIPFEDNRKIISSLILAPYLINVKGLPFQECFKIIKEWLDKYNSLEKLDDSRSFNSRISSSLKNAKYKQIGPMSQHKI